MVENKIQRYKILPIFLPHQGCPHQCVFCDQNTITENSAEISIEWVRKQIVEFGLKSDFNPSSHTFKEVAFYGSTFTAMPASLQRSLLKPASEALERGHIDGIRISTRPDYCDHMAIELLKELHVKTVEVGVQSMDHEVLRRSGRGHGREESVQAVKTLKREGFITGVQLMPGLPGEDIASFLSTIRDVISLNPAFVRLYPTIVIKGTPLEGLYQKGLYQPLSMEKAIDRCKKGIILFRKAGIRVIRCGIQPTPSLQKKGSICIGPFHPAFGELVESSIMFDQVNLIFKKISLSSDPAESIFIRSSFKGFSILKGQKGSNLQRLKSLYPGRKIFMNQDPTLPDDLIRVSNESGSHWDIQKSIRS